MQPLSSAAEQQEPGEPPVAPSVPASSVKADVTRGRAGGLRSRAPGEGNSIHASSELRDAWKMCSRNTVAPRETKKVALCSLSAARLPCWGPGPQSRGGDRLSKAGAGLKPTRKVQLAEHS